MYNNRDIYGSYDCGGFDDFEIRREQVKTNKIIILIIGGIALYIGFLYLGYSSTSFKTNEVGERVGVVVNLSDREGQEDYERLKGYYKALGLLFDEVYLMENNIQTGAYDSFTYATKYNEILQKIDSYMSGVVVANVDEKYYDMKTSINNSFNNFAIYCQKMNTALTNDSYEQYLQANTWLKTSEQSYEELSQKFLDFGNSVKIYNDKDLEWYVAKKENQKLISDEKIEENDSLIQIQGEETNWEEGGLRTGNSIFIEEEIEDNEENKEIITDNVIESILNGTTKENEKENSGYGKPLNNSSSEKKEKENTSNNNISNNVENTNKNNGRLNMD